MDLANCAVAAALRDFPKNHNLVLISRPSLLAALDLGVNQDIKSRVTYSVITKRLGPDAMRDFILRENSTASDSGTTPSTQPAVDLIVRSADGVLRQAAILRRLPDRGRPLRPQNHRHRQRQRVCCNPTGKEADLVDF
jgi:hypothetical protein